MAVFNLGRTQLELLVGCIHVGLDGAECGDPADEMAIAALLEELEGVAAHGGGAEITVMREG